MDFIPFLRQRRNALIACCQYKDFPQQIRKQVREDLNLMDYAFYGAKTAVVLAIIFGVNWKKPASLMRRQIPLAFGAVSTTILSDYMISQHVWKKHEDIVVELTGYKDGIFIKPQKLIRMKNSMRNMKNQKTKIEDDIIIEDDEQFV